MAMVMAVLSGCQSAFIHVPPGMVAGDKITASDVSFIKQLSADPVSSELHFAVGKYYYETDEFSNFELARSAFQTALKYSPDSAKNYLGIAASSYRLGSYLEAMVAYLNAILRQKRQDINFVHFSAVAYRAGLFDISYTAFLEINPQKIADQDRELYNFLRRGFESFDYSSAVFSYGSDDSSQENENPSDQSIVADAFLIQHFVSNRESVGQNFLENLGFGLAGSISWEKSINLLDDTYTESLDRALVASLPSNLQYSLEILSDEVTRTRIEANPNIILSTDSPASISRNEIYNFFGKDEDGNYYFSDEGGLTTGVDVVLELINAKNNTAELQISIRTGTLSDVSDSNSGLLNLNYVKSEDFKIETRAEIPYGRVITLGGISLQSLADKESGVTGIRKVPLLGRVFGQENQEYRRDDAAILIAVRKSNLATGQDLRRRSYELVNKLNLSLHDWPKKIGENPADMPPIVTNF